MTDNSQKAFLSMEDSEGIGGGWSIANLSSEPRGHVMVNLESDQKGATVEVLITAPGSSAEAFVETPLGNVAYREYSGISEREVAEVTRSFAQRVSSGKVPLTAFFPHLAVDVAADRPPGKTRDLLEGMFQSHQRLLPGAVSSEGTLTLPEGKSGLFFDPPGLAEFLAPELVIDGAPMGRYTLSAIYLPPVARRETPDFNSYVLEFSQEQGPSTHVVVGARGAFPQVFGYAGPLAVGVRHFGQGEQDGLGPEQAQICSWVVALLEMKQGPKFELSIPKEARELRALSLPAHRAQALDIKVGDDSAPVLNEQRVLNLSIDSDCGQQCTFCSVKSYLSPQDGGDKELERIRMQLRKARAEGIGGVRINGIDPMRFSRILDVVETIEELGFKRLSVYTTGRAFAEGGMRRAFLDRYSSELCIVIPIYGVTPEVHDAVVGTEGAHAEAVAALDGLLREALPGQVAISTVVVKQNVHEFNKITAFAFERSITLEAHLPYPMRQTTRDPYADSALPEDEVIRRFVATLGDIEEEKRKDAARWLGHMVRHPCLLWDAEFRHQLPLFGTRALGLTTYMDGTDYRRSLYTHASQVQSEDSAFAAATIACPHVSDCALSSVCPGEHYALYDELFGLEAFRPITIQEIYGTLLEHKVSAVHEKRGKMEVEERRAQTQAAIGKLRIAATTTIQGQMIQVNALRVLSEFEPKALRALDRTRDEVQEMRLALLRDLRSLVDRNLSFTRLRSLLSAEELEKDLSEELEKGLQVAVASKLEEGLDRYGRVVEELQKQMGRVERSAGAAASIPAKSTRLSFEESESLAKEAARLSAFIRARVRGIFRILTFGTVMATGAFFVPSPVAVPTAFVLMMILVLWLNTGLGGVRAAAMLQLGTLVSEKCGTMLERVERARDKDWAFHRGRCFTLFERLQAGVDGIPALPATEDLLSDTKNINSMPEITPFEVVLADLQSMSGKPDE